MKNNLRSAGALGPFKVEKSSGNLFADFGFSTAEALNLAMRTDCMITIDTRFKSSGLTQAMAATQLGLIQPRFNAMLKGASNSSRLMPL